VKESILTAAALAALSLISAQPSSAQSFERAYYYVSKIQISDDNHLSLNVSTNFDRRHGCPQLSWAQSRYPLTDERTKALLAIAMQSFERRQQVYIYTKGCNIGGYPILLHMQIRQPPHADPSPLPLVWQ
jgi:hypothetical protein